MTVAELRINNWYKNMSIDNPFNQIKYGHEIDYVAVYCEPIPLTREWILNFGFQEKYSEKRIYFRIKGMLIEVKNGSKFYYNNIHLKHVHQLQNLYFALTNEELKISEL